MLSSQELQTIASIKSKVRSMLIERAAVESRDEKFASPSDYWSDFCRQFKYVLGMQDEDFDLLRVHTYHLDGDTYQSYFFATPEFLKQHVDYEGQTDYDTLIKGVPAQFLLSAPVRLGEYGLQVDGRVLNMTLLRMQRVVRTLYHYAGLELLIGRRSTILEIGGGYGCLAYHLSHILNNATYVIVDLPETLLFSAVYLAITAPEKRLLLWDGGIDVGSVTDYDFVLIPNYAAEHLQQTRFDLAINVASFQELRPQQLDRYLRLIHRSTALLYSWNRDIQDRNNEGTSVTVALENYFQLQSIEPPPPPPTPVSSQPPTPAYRVALRRGRRAASALVRTLRQRPAPPPPSPPARGFLVHPYREYLCRPLERIA